MNKRNMTSVKETSTVPNIDDLVNEDKEDLPF